MIGPTFTIGASKVHWQDAGAASGTLSAALQIGSATGVVLLGVLFFNVLIGGAGSSFDAQSAGLRTQLSSAGVSGQAQDAIVVNGRTCFVDRIGAKDPALQPPSCAAVNPGSAAAGQAIGTAAGNAKADAFSKGFRFFDWFAAAALVIAALLAQLMPKKIEQQQSWG